MLINYKNVNVFQSGDKPVLANVNFHVDEGEFIYVIGRVGSGKSSLLKTIYFELDIDEAEEAMILNQDLLKLKRKHVPALRRQMGIIFQDFQLLGDRTVYKNLRFVLKATGWKDKKEINTRIKEVLSDVGLEDKADKLPHELSGGEQQRVALARALVHNPDLVIADEPTGNIDPALSIEIMELLKAINSIGTTVVVVTHEHELAHRYAKRIIEIRSGRIVDDTADPKFKQGVAPYEEVKR